MLAVCCRNHCFEFQLKAKTVAIGKKRKPGRPKNTRPAFEVQDEEHLLSDTDEEVAPKPKKPKTTKPKKRANQSSSESDYDIYATGPVASVVPSKQVANVQPSTSRAALRNFAAESDRESVSPPPNTLSKTCSKTTAAASKRSKPKCKASKKARLNPEFPAVQRTSSRLKDK